MRTLVAWLFHPRSLFFLLPAFMLLLVAGTWAQKYMGLFPATQLFFNSWVLWAGPVPLPGGVTLLALIGVNMAAHFITKSEWTMPGLGTTLTHLGVLILLFGGLLTLYTKQDGFVILRHGQPTNTMVDYHTRELTLSRDGRIVHTLTQHDLKQNTSLRVGNADIHLEKIYRNSRLKPVEKRPAHCSGLACEFTLDEQPALSDDEQNQMGLILRAGTRRFILSEFINGPVTLGDWRIDFKRASYVLPFSLAMTGFDMTTYPGSDTAKSYRTDLTLSDHDKKTDHSIAMNAPLRHRNYVFYQASTLTLANGETASVLNAVKNPAWVFPYAATLLFLAGFVIHIWGRRRV